MAGGRAAGLPAGKTNGAVPLAVLVVARAGCAQFKFIQAFAGPRGPNRKSNSGQTADGKAARNNRRDVSARARAQLEPDGRARNGVDSVRGPMKRNAPRTMSALAARQPRRPSQQRRLLRRQQQQQQLETKTRAARPKLFSLAATVASSRLAANLAPRLSFPRRCLTTLRLA